jgi:hypothetical protein
MEQRKRREPSREHEEVYHAASRCQGKRSGLTAGRGMVRRSHAQVKAKKQTVWPLKKQARYATLRA